MIVKPIWGDRESGRESGQNICSKIPISDGLSFHLRPPPKKETQKCKDWSGGKTKDRDRTKRFSWREARSGDLRIELKDVT